MNFNSYSDLQAAIASYLKRNNLTDQIPSFIALAEVRINRDLNNMPQALTAWNITPTQNFVTLPGDFNSLERVVYGDTPLTWIPFSQAKNSNESYNAGFYTIVGQKLWINTSIQTGQKLSVYYYQNIEPLSDANISNWVLEEAYDLYLYAALMEASPYLVNDARIGVWQQAYAQGVASMQQNAKQSTTTADKLIMKRG